MDIVDQTVIDEARAHVQSHFRWLDGDADVWSMLHHGESLRAIATALTALAAHDRPDVIVGVESRGFVLAPAVAVQLGVGFVAVRKDGAIFPGSLEQRQTEPDYRGNRSTLSMRRDHVAAGARLVIVDDWVETGSQARAVTEMVRDLGAEVVSLVTIIDETSDAIRRRLPPVRSLLRGDDLPNHDGR